MEEYRFLVREIEYNSKEYKKALELRDRILRKPLGLNLFDEDLSKEVNDYHLAIFKDEELVGTLILSPVNGAIKMRQVAVEPAIQGMKAGSQLIKYSEKIARDKNFIKIELHARKTAVFFYLKNGYQIEGNEFQELAIPHFKMIKNL